MSNGKDTQRSTPAVQRATLSELLLQTMGCGTSLEWIMFVQFDLSLYVQEKLSQHRQPTQADHLLHRQPLQGIVVWNVFGQRLIID